MTERGSVDPAETDAGSALPTDERAATGKGPDAEPAAEHEGAVDLREQFRSQLLTGLGGWTGMIIAAIPTVVFVVVNALSGLRAGILAAVGSAVALAGYRLVRRQSVQQAFSGLFGVLVAALIAARTGQARGYFLLGIGSSILYAAVFAVSLVVRRPLVGVVWEFLDPSDPDAEERPWHRRPVLRRAYFWATVGALAVFASRGIVQLALFGEHATGWLAVARITMGYPLTAAALAFGFWIVRRARRQLADADETADPAAVGRDADGDPAVSG